MVELLVLELVVELELEVELEVELELELEAGGVVAVDVGVDEVDVEVDEGLDEEVVVDELVAVLVGVEVVVLLDDDADSQVSPTIVTLIVHASAEAFGSAEIAIMIRVAPVNASTLHGFRQPRNIARLLEVISVCAAQRVAAARPRWTGSYWLIRSFAIWNRTARSCRLTADPTLLDAQNIGRT